MTETLLRALDALSHSARQAHLVTFHRDTPREVVAACAAELAGGDAYRRGLAVDLWRLLGDRGAVRAALSDRSVRVRSRAAAVAASQDDDPRALAAAALAVDLHTRHRLCRHLARHRRVDVAAELAPPLLERGEWSTVGPLLGLLPWEVARELAEERGDELVAWRRMALRHPAPTLDHLRARLQATPHRAQVIWLQFASALDALIHHDAEATLALLEAHPPRHAGLLRPVLGPLLRRFGDRVIELLLAIEGTWEWFQLGERRRRHLRVASDPVLARLAGALARTDGALFQLLRALPPSRRAAVFAGARAERPEHLWSPVLLEILPHEVRHAEARRWAASPQVRGNLEAQRTFAAWLPIDEAVAQLVPEGRPRERQGADRARTWMLWANAVGHDRRGLDDLLAASASLKNEQDPVRAGFFMGLEQVPVRMFGPEHVPALDQLSVAVLEARDSGTMTTHHVRELAHRLILAHADRPDDARFQLGLAMLERGLRRGQKRYTVGFPPGLRRGLRRGAELAIADAVLDWLEGDVARERDGSALNLAARLEERAQNVPRLQELLFTIATTARSNGSRVEAARLWLHRAPDRDRRVRALLDHDESFVTIGPVFEHLARRRQDWLDPFLTGRRLRGRLASDKGGWVPWQPVACRTWLPRQEAALAEVYLGLASDPQHNLAVRANAVRNAASLGAVDVQRLLPFVEGGEVNLIEAGLGALVWLDEPAPALPVLLDHLDADRARVAMYALPRLARLIGPDDLQRALRGILDRERLKVTVHKEAIRLLGAHRLPDSAELLAREWARPDLHRDVRIAMIHAAWARLDEAWAWDLLAEAAAHPDAQVPVTLCAVSPPQVPRRHRPRVLGTLLTVADHPEALARVALARHLSRGESGLGPSDPPTAAAGAARLATEPDPTSQVSWSAIVGLVELGSLPGGAEAAVEGFERLLALAATDPVVAMTEDELDLPFFRRLEHLCEALGERALPDPDRYRELADRLVARLGPEHFLVRTELELAATPTAGLPARFAALEQACPSPLLLSELGCVLAESIEAPRRRISPDDGPGLVDAVQDAELVVPVLEAAGTRLGWSTELRTRVGELRRDPAWGALARSIVVR